MTPDKVVDAIKEYGGRVIRTSLSEKEEANLRDAFGTGMPARAEVPPPSPISGKAATPHFLDVCGPVIVGVHLGSER